MTKTGNNEGTALSRSQKHYAYEKQFYTKILVTKDVHKRLKLASIKAGSKNLMEYMDTLSRLTPVKSM